MSKASKRVLYDDSDGLESIIKIEPEKFDDQWKIEENDKEKNYWPRVVVKNILLPTVALKRLGAKEIEVLTADPSKTIKKKKKKKPVAIKIKTAKPISKYKCDDCDQEFVFRYERSRHILKIHFQGEKFECECGKLHRHRSSFYACRSSHRTKGFECKLCERPFDSRTAYQSHWKNMHLKEHGRLQIDSIISLNKKGDFTCDVCGRVLKGRKAILRHLTYQHFNPDLRCDLCPYTVKRIGDLRIHMDRHHLNVKPYHCHLCKYKTAFQSNFRSHLRRHPGSKVKKLYGFCKICNQKMQKRSFYAHMTNLHGSTCRHCFKAFESNGELTRHFKAKHPDVPFRRCRECGNSKYFMMCICLPTKGPFTCDLCAKVKITRRGIAGHLRKHLNFGAKCGICAYHAVSRKNLGIHIQKKHRKVKKEK